MRSIMWFSTLMTSEVRHAISLSVKVRRHRVSVPCADLRQVQQVSLVERVAGLTDMNVCLPPLTKHRIHYVWRLTVNTVPQGVLVACCVLEQVCLYHVRADCTSLRDASVRLPEELLLWFFFCAGHTFMSGRLATRSTSNTCWTCRGSKHGTLTRWWRTFALTYTGWRTSTWWGWRSLIHGSDDYRRTMEQLLKRKFRTYRSYGINTQEWGSVRKWREHYIENYTRIDVYQFQLYFNVMQ